MAPDKGEHGKGPRLELLTKLFDVVGSAAGILFELLLKHRTIGPEEVLDGEDGVVVLSGALEWLQGGQVLLTRAFEAGNREFGKLLLVSKGDAWAGGWIRVVGEGIPCFGRERRLTVSGRGVRADGAVDLGGRHVRGLGGKGAVE